MTAAHAYHLGVEQVAAWQHSSDQDLAPGVMSSAASVPADEPDASRTAAPMIDSQGADALLSERLFMQPCARLANNQSDRSFLVT